MTVALTGAQSWGVRIGHIGGLLNNVYGLLGTTAPSPGSAWGASGPTISALETNLTNIYGDFTTNNPQLVAGSSGIYSFRDSFRNTVAGNVNALQTLAQALTIKMVDDDVTLTAGQGLVDALRELVRQMKVSADNIAKPTVTITPGSGNRADNLAVVGNPVLVGCVLGPDGLQCDHTYNEVIDLLCLADSYSGGQTAYQERYGYLGDAAVGLLDWNWPKGSGCSGQLNAVDAAVDAGTNLLTNSSFDKFTVANTPDNWTIRVGAAGTNVFSEPTDVYRSGGKALKITGDAGLTLTDLYQVVTLKPSTVYFLNGFLHVDAAAPAAGKLQFSIADGTFNTTVNDDQGNANAYTVDLTKTTLQTTYVATGAMTTTQLNGQTLAGGAGGIMFRTPTNMPTVTVIRINLVSANAITNTKNVFLDHLALTPGTQFYGSGIGGGPYAALFSGSIKALAGDAHKWTAANNYGSKFQKFLWRVMNLPQLGLQMPSSGTGTIADTLMV